MSKKRIVEGIAVFLVAFLITSFANFFIDYATSSSGEITKGAIIQIDNSNFYSLEIVNHSNNSVNGLRVSVPDDFITNQIQSNRALKFELDEYINAKHSKLSISGIEPESKYLVLLPYHSNSPSDFSVLNNQEFGLDVNEFGLLGNPSLAIIKSATLDAIIYSIFVFIVFVFISNKFDKYKADLVESRKIMEKLRQQVDNAHQQYEGVLEDTTNTHRRIKTLLTARISDYSKELKFWRNTIKRILISQYDRSDDSVDELLKEISNSLNTQSTLALNNYNFAEIEVMLNLLKKEEN